MRTAYYLPNQEQLPLPKPGWEVVTEPTSRGGTRTFLRKRRYDPQEDPENGSWIIGIIVMIIIIFFLIKTFSA